MLPAGPQGTIVKAQSTLVADQRPTGAAHPQKLQYACAPPVIKILEDWRGCAEKEW